MAAKLLDHGLHVRIVTTYMYISLNSLEHGQQVHPQNLSITASKCICNIARLRPLRLHDHVLQVSLETRSITIS
jgi:hypothetical protein